METIRELKIVCSVEQIDLLTYIDFGWDPCYEKTEWSNLIGSLLSKSSGQTNQRSCYKHQIFIRRESKDAKVH